LKIGRALKVDDNSTKFIKMGKTVLALSCQKHLTSAW